jgi:hypothetical protein
MLISMQAIPGDTPLSAASAATLSAWLAKKDATLAATAKISIATFSWAAAVCKVAPASPLADPSAGKVIAAVAAAAAACLNAATVLGKLQSAGVQVSRCLDPAVAAAFDLASVVAVDLSGYAVLHQKLQQQGIQQCPSTDQGSSEQLTRRQQKLNRKQRQQQQQPPAELPQAPKELVLHLHWQYTQMYEVPKGLLLSAPYFTTVLVTSLLALYGWQLQQHLAVRLLRDQAKQEQAGRFDQCMVAMQQLLGGSGADAAAEQSDTKLGGIQAAGAVQV